MFGGIAFLLDDKMFCGLAKGELMVRVGPDQYEAALKERHARPMDFTGRPMVGYVYVAPAGLKSDAALERWVQRGAGFVATVDKAKNKPATKKTTAKKAVAKKTLKVTKKR